MSFSMQSNTIAKNKGAKIYGDENNASNHHIGNIRSYQIM